MKTSLGYNEPVKIETSQLLELMLQPEFYTECVEYFFLRDQAITIIARWKEGKLRFAERALQIPLQGFILHTEALQEAFGDHGPASVIRFFQKALGSPRNHFVVYYRRERSEVRQLHFYPGQGGSDGNPRTHAE